MTLGLTRTFFELSLSFDLFDEQKTRFLCGNQFYFIVFQENYVSLTRSLARINLRKGENIVEVSDL